MNTEEVNFDGNGTTSSGDSGDYAQTTGELKVLLEGSIVDRVVFVYQGVEFEIERLYVGLSTIREAPDGKPDLIVNFLPPDSLWVYVARSIICQDSMYENQRTITDAELCERRFLSLVELRNLFYSYKDGRSGCVSLTSLRGSLRRKSKDAARALCWVGSLGESSGGVSVSCDGGVLYVHLPEAIADDVKGFLPMMI